MREHNLTRRQLLMAGSTASALLLAACGGAPEEPEEEPVIDGPIVEDDHAPDSLPVDEGANESETDAADGKASGSKILVVYYSRADENYPGEWLEVGHTKVMAGYIAEALGADQYEIVPVEPYPEGYDDCCDVALAEQRDDARPAISEALSDVSGYELVFIGCPIWWGDEPMIVRTFLDGVNLSGKTVVPFTTHGGSGLGSVPSNLQAAVPDARFLDGLAVAGTEVDGARDEVVSWAKGYALA